MLAMASLHETIAKGTTADGLFSDCKKAHRDLQGQAAKG
jgi:hypothetical protein